jgi:Rrf2 family protein
MKLSTRVRFGLRIMLQIAAEQGERPVFSRRIALTQGISEAYVDQILLPLRTGGLLTSQRGRSGGYRLAKSASEISTLDILQALEGKIALADCVDNPATCGHADTCVAHRVWTKMTNSLRESLESTTLAQLRDQEIKLKDESNLHI